MTVFISSDNAAGLTTAGVSERAAAGSDSSSDKAGRPGTPEFGSSKNVAAGTADTSARSADGPGRLTSVGLEKPDLSQGTRTLSVANSMSSSSGPPMYTP